jgi:hypothetical protein
MRASHIVPIVGLFLLVGCPAAPAPEAPLTLDGQYEAQEPGPIVYVTFEPDGRYELRKACPSGDVSACTEHGKYAVSAAHDQLVLEADGGGTSTLPFAIVDHQAPPSSSMLGPMAMTNNGGAPLLDGQKYQLLIGGKTFLVGCRGPADCPGAVCCTTIKFAGFLTCTDPNDVESLTSQCTTSCRDSLSFGCHPNTVISCNSSQDCAARSVDGNFHCCAFPQRPTSFACVGDGTKPYAISCR